MTHLVTNKLSRIGTGLAAVALALSLAACAPAGPSGYNVYETQRAQRVEMGVVESVRGVQINARDSGVGTVGGAALGGLAGSAIGQGNGNVAAVIAGAILGGVAGNAIERDANRRNGVEVTVRLDNGRMLAVVQQDSGDVMRPGDRVRVMSDGYATRVSR